MSAHDRSHSESNPEGQSSTSQADRAPAPPSAAPPQAAVSSKRQWAWAIGAGLIAASLAWTCGEAARRAFPEALKPKIVAFPTAADAEKIIADKTKSAALNFIVQGTVLGAVLGLAGGLSRGSLGRGLLALVIGAILGAAGAGGASAVLPIYYRNVNPETEALGLAMLTHGAFWAAIGAAAGAAFGIGRGGRMTWFRCGLGGLLGGIGATVLYDVVGALTFPLDKTSEPVAATTVTRVIAQFSVGLLVAAGAALGIQEQGGKVRSSDALAD